MAIMILGVTWSCQVNDEVDPIEPTAFFEDPGKVKLGKKLENPYSVVNMQKAWNNISGDGSRIPEEVDIEATHYYVKFIPQTEEELDVLKSDSTLVLYDYPLDYEIKEGGDYYHDPDVPEDQPTPQYCAVGVDYLFPTDVEYEIIEELFIPDDYSDDANENDRVASEWVIDEWVDEALRITNNLEEGDGANIEEPKNGGTARGRRSNWRPAGRLLFWDNQVGQTTVTKITGYHEVVVGYQDICYSGGYDCIRREIVNRVPIYGTEIVGGSYVGLEGVEVRANRWFTTHEGISNSQGNYSCDGTFKREANYKVRWERWHFKIRKGTTIHGAIHDGPEQRGNWNVNFGSSSGPDAQHHYASIFRPAYHYYYQDINGLRRPPQNGTFKTQLKIAAITSPSGECKGMSSNGCHSSGWRAFGLSNPVKIWSYGRDADHLYGTVIHELAHASHYNMSHWHFRNILDHESRVKESWATGVAWELTRMKYPQYKGVVSEIYTGVVIDMIDRHPPVNPNNGSDNPDEDGVTGYTIRQIEDALFEKRSWIDWRNSIISKYYNATENNLDELFDHWAN